MEELKVGNLYTAEELKDKLDSQEFIDYCIDNQICWKYSKLADISEIHFKFGASEFLLSIKKQDSAFLSFPVIEIVEDGCIKLSSCYGIEEEDYIILDCSARVICATY
jgi:hypothetical protein